jgi:hypothetical protein
VGVHITSSGVRKLAASFRQRKYLSIATSGGHDPQDDNQQLDQQLDVHGSASLQVGHKSIYARTVLTSA